MIVDIELSIDGLNVDSLKDIEELVKELEDKLDTIYPLQYIIRSCE